MNEPSMAGRAAADPHEAEPNADESLLAELLAQLADDVQHGRPSRLAELEQAHPRLAGELRALFAAVQIAEGIAHFSGSRDGEQLPGATKRAPAANPSSAVMFPLPRTLGDFELIEELGRGGMGIVYRAIERSLNRTVAVKMILRGDFATSNDQARFRAEAESAARLDHSNIVPVYGVGEIEGHPYFSMKYIAGTTLARKLSDGPLPPREAAALLLPVCRAIHYAHTRGLLHRDLKPSNILIDTEGVPHVTDFGLAKLVTGGDSLTRSGAILGTPSYMAPEQAAGGRGKLGPASDVYSLGTILYQMLTGKPPFQAATPVDTVLLVLEQEPLPPRVVNPRADRDLEMISLRCLQKPPDLRYPSAAALADDLEAYLHDEPVSARSGLITQVVVRWFRETHHAAVLENWGLLWIWHSLALLVICVLTNALQLWGVKSPSWYFWLWSAGLGTWAGIFWALRRRAGPVTFVERQIAHVWAGSMASISLLFLVEILLGLPVLTLSPVLAISSGMVFLSKAGILTGRFYVQAIALFATSIVMAVLARLGIPIGITLFGVVSSLCFLLPGIKYHRQRIRGQA